MKIYVAGPMRGIPDFNFPAFNEASARLRGEGHIVFNPAEKDIERNGDSFASSTGDEKALTNGFDLRVALLEDLEWICKEAEAVAVLPGWENSKGANAEVATARALGLVVFSV